MYRWSTLGAAAALALASCTANDTSPEGTPTAAAAGETTMTPPAPEPTGTRTAAGEATQADGDAESDSCGASKVRARWLGAMHTPEVEAQIAAAVGRRTIRTYTDGDAITMDYSEDRLNVVLGRDGRIAEFRCG